MSTPHTTHRCANLPDSLSTLPANVHLGLLSANEYYVVDDESGVLRREIRGPKSLEPHLTVLVDDLLAAYNTGITVCDSTLALADLDYVFQCRVMLLYWTGDYPAQALVSGTHSKTCHWCRHKSRHAPEINRRCWCDYRRYLPEDHELRAHGAFGLPEGLPPPEHRSHAGFVEDALANVRHRGLKKDAPYKSTGVKSLSPLAALPMFDLVWDVLPDMMHVVPNIWKAHVFQMFMGKRNPAQPRARKSLSKKENDELMAEHKEAVAELKAWHLSEEWQAELDRRSQHLGGEAHWIRGNLKVCANSHALKAHDWMLVIQTAGRYLLDGLFADDPDKADCLLRLLEATNRCLKTTSAWDSENREVIDAVKLQVVEALCHCETYMPRTEMPVMFHILLHVPDAIYRWNAVRNYWGFFGERYPSLCQHSVHICSFHLLPVDILSTFLFSVDIMSTLLCSTVDVVTLSQFMFENSFQSTFCRHLIQVVDRM